MICKHACSQVPKWWLSPSKQTFAWWNMFSFYASKGQLKNSTMSMGNAVDGFE
jgi:hypothetical protein